MYTKTKMLTSSIEINTGLDFIKVLIPEKYTVQLLELNTRVRYERSLKLIFDKIKRFEQTNFALIKI
jgi:hypothetical protein